MGNMGEKVLNPRERVSEAGDQERYITQHPDWEGVHGISHICKASFNKHRQSSRLFKGAP